jgi:hypothetical protein
MVDIFLDGLANGSGQVRIGDPGPTLMRLTYPCDLDTGNKRRIFHRIKSSETVCLDSPGETRAAGEARDNGREGPCTIVQPRGVLARDRAASGPHSLHDRADDGHSPRKSAPAVRRLPAGVPRTPRVHRCVMPLRAADPVLATNGLSPPRWSPAAAAIARLDEPTRSRCVRVSRCAGPWSPRPGRPPCRRRLKRCWRRGWRNWGG